MLFSAVTADNVITLCVTDIDTGPLPWRGAHAKL
jgi:hypothetical protein